MKPIGFKEFVENNSRTIRDFENNNLFKLISSSQISNKHYETFLLSIFHQTFHAAVSFASAGANCPNKNYKIRDYLIKHAEEEHTHWNWVISDLQNIGYQGPDPLTLFPNKSCSAYIAFNFYLASRYPLARLGAAAVLEGIGAGLGAKYGRNLIAQLGLKPNQMTFIMSHSETDVEHVEEIFTLLRNSELSPEDWRWLIYGGQMAGMLYRDMYDEIALASLERAA